MPYESVPTEGPSTSNYRNLAQPRFFEKKPRFGVWGLGWFRVSGFQNHSASLNPGYHPILGVDTLRAVGRYKHEDERCKDEAF